MATPLNSLRLFIAPGSKQRPWLSPLSPCSPLSPQLSPLPPSFLKNKNLNTKSRARKQLDYNFKSPNKLTPSINIVVSHSSPIESGNNSALLVNTPNKNFILQEGLHNFKNLNIIGRGSFGTVVRGSYLGQDVAVKVIKTKATTNEKNALGFKHQNVVNTIDVLIKNNEQHSIIVMEYLPNSQVLQSVIDNESVKIDFEVMVHCVLDITAGLEYIHSQNLLHLDLKPGNVVISDGKCKICDFGNSEFIPTTFCDEFEENKRCYEGTVQYTSPEILTGKPATIKCDIYSLGITMWQLRYRQNPYMFMECRDTIIYNVVKYGLRPNAALQAEMRIEDDYSALYQSCWLSEPMKRPNLDKVQQRLVKLVQHNLT